MPDQDRSPGTIHHPSTAGLVPTAEDRAELLAVVGEQARASGWVQRVDGPWLCPEHGESYLGWEPESHTAAECARRRRLRAHQQHVPGTSRVA